MLLLQVAIAAAAVAAASERSSNRFVYRRDRSIRSPHWRHGGPPRQEWRLIAGPLQ